MQATDSKGRPISVGDTVNLRAVVVDLVPPVLDPVTGEPAPGSCVAVTVQLDPADPGSPRFVFRDGHLERA